MLCFHSRVSALFSVGFEQKVQVRKCETDIAKLRGLRFFPRKATFTQYNPPYLAQLGNYTSVYNGLKVKRINLFSLTAKYELRN